MYNGLHPGTLVRLAKSHRWGGEVARVIKLGCGPMKMHLVELTRKDGMKGHRVFASSNQIAIRVDG